MIVLAFDTATPATAVAITNGDEAWEARHDPAPGERPGHATRLLPLLRDVLRDAGLTWEAIERIGVGLGPGSFTGLRIGVATARALAQARDLPLVGVSTLHALAVGAAEAHDGPVLAVVDARRGEAFAAAWHAGDQVLAPAALAPESLAGAVRDLARGDRTPLAAGDGAVRFRAQLEANGALVPADQSPLHRVSARRHCRLAAREEPGPRDAVVPLYLRIPDAELSHRSP